MMPRQKLEPSWLPPGTVVGPWKVKGWHGGGAYGAVFRAVIAGREHGGWVALKVAWWPGDRRFEREVGLLERMGGHPNVPRLWGRGVWQHPSGASYPYIVMEWVEGVELYAWAERSNPGSPAVARVLAQVARALEAAHAVGGVHRDVKGGNILVSSAGWARLIDFGAGNYAGAERLTREGLPPGTDNYRSPEAWEFELHRPRNSMEVYKAQSADDVFALGVSAWRLVTGEYLPPVEVSEEEGVLRLVWREPRALRELNARVAPELSALIMTMLARRPEERLGAGELAEALEQAARSPSPGAERPVLGREERAAPAEGLPAEQRQGREEERSPEPVVLAPVRARSSSWVGYVACGILGGVLATAVLRWGEREEGASRQHGAFEREEFGGTEPAGVGDTGLTAPVVEVGEPSGWVMLGLPMPDEPLEGQRRVPHCIPPVEVGINGGCWIRLADAKPPCGSISYEWNGSCYLPSYPARRKSTSQQPAQSGADGGATW